MECKWVVKYWILKVHSKDPSHNGKYSCHKGSCRQKQLKLYQLVLHIALFRYTTIKLSSFSNNCTVTWKEMLVNSYQFNVDQILSIINVLFKLHHPQIKNTIRKFQIGSCNTCNFLGSKFHWNMKGKYKNMLTMTE